MIWDVNQTWWYPGQDRGRAGCGRGEVVACAGACGAVRDLEDRGVCCLLGGELWVLTHDLSVGVLEPRFIVPGQHTSHVGCRLELCGELIHCFRHHVI